MIRAAPPLLVALASLAAPTPAAAEAPKKMAIGFYVNALRGVDWRARTFVADLYWWIRYPKPATDEEQQALEALEFTNVDAGEMKHQVLERKVLPSPEGEQVYVSYRTTGSFVFEGDFRLYPLDTQQLPIIVEHTTRTVDQLELIDDVASYRRSGLAEGQWGLSESLRVPELVVLSTRRTVDRRIYRTDFGDTSLEGAQSTYSRFALTIEVGRSFGPYLVKILIPLLIILLLAYLVFFVPAEELEVAAGLTVTSLLSCIAFQLTVASDLPEIGYVVLSDRLFHLCYLLIMLAMAETVYTFNLERQGRAAVAERLERWARWLYAAIFVVGSVAIIGFGIGARG